MAKKLKLECFIFLFLIAALYLPVNCTCGPEEKDEDDEDSDADDVNWDEMWYEKYEECMRLFDDCCQMADDDFTYMMLEVVCSGLKTSFEIDPSGPCMENAINQFFDCCCEICTGEQTGFFKDCLPLLIEEMDECEYS